MDVQLLTVNDGVSIWGKHYDVGPSSVLSVQHDITKQVARALKIPMSAVDQAQIYREHTRNGAAYELYLNGRTLLLRHTEEGIRKAADAFDAALRLDPNYALAYAGLAMARSEMPSRFA